MHTLWKRFVDLFKILDEDCLNLSNGWLNIFKNETSLHSIRQNGEAESVSYDTFNAERACVCAITDLYVSANIYNMDETSHF